MTPLAWTAVTDFLLAGVTFFLSGMLFGRHPGRGSAAWFWSYFTMFLGIAAFLAAVDHGFIEGRNFLPDTNFVSRTSWIFVGLAVAAMLAGLARQYFPRHRWILIVGAVQLVVYVVVILTQDFYIFVSINMVPELVLALVSGLVFMRSRPGSLALAVGIVVIIIAAVIQAMGFDALNPLNHNSLYHLISVIGVVSLYLAGRRFNTTIIPT